MGNVSEMMHRVRLAIKEHDPSYRLKLNGHICAKEWREIIFGVRGDYRYFLLDTKVDDVRLAVEQEEALRKLYGDGFVNYSVDDLAVISELMRAGNRRKKRLTDGKIS